MKIDIYFHQYGNTLDNYVYHLGHFQIMGLFNDEPKFGQYHPSRKVEKTFIELWHTFHSLGYKTWFVDFNMYIGYQDGNVYEHIEEDINRLIKFDLEFYQSNTVYI